ncbi:MAG: hypothetical protein QNK11_05400 [Legionella sp.]|nr:hypothetical protein [Legionella sp.]
MSFLAVLEEENQKTLLSKDYAFLMDNYAAIKTEKMRLDTALKHFKSTELSNKADKKYFEYLETCNILLSEYKRIHDEPIWSNSLTESLAYYHMIRMHLSFVRMLIAQLALLLACTQALAVLAVPVMALYVLSVAFLATQAIIEIALILKHTFAGSTEEQKISFGKRFKHELDRYKFDLVNAFVWAPLNYINIGSVMLACVLVDFVTGKLKVDLELGAYNKEKTTYIPADSNKKLSPVEEKLKEIFELEHAKNSAKLKLILAATVILGVGFTLLTTAFMPFLVPIGSLLCVLGTATILSLEKHDTYQEKTFFLKQLDKNKPSSLSSSKLSLTYDKDMADAQKAQKIAWDEGFAHFAKQAFMPMLLIGTIALCWPAGLLLTAAYIAYECELLQKATSFDAPAYSQK